MCDLALQHIRMLEWEPGVIAASAIELARHAVGSAPLRWGDFYGWEPKEACVKALAHIVPSCDATSSSVEAAQEAKPDPLVALKEYYADVDCFEVSKLEIGAPPDVWPAGDGRVEAGL